MPGEESERRLPGQHLDRGRPDEVADLVEGVDREVKRGDQPLTGAESWCREIDKSPRVVETGRFRTLCR